ncbi:MAG TPA: sigma 54-interacting transcriptional regulator [Mucilaginibacter sp.]
MQKSINNEIDRPNQIATALRLRIEDVHERADLIKMLTDLLKTHFNFNGIFIQSVDPHTGTYYPFLIDHHSKARDLNEFKALSNTRASIQDPIVRDAIKARHSFVVSLKDFTSMPAVPYWIKINFEYGIRKGLVTPLRIKDEVVGVCYIWFDNQDPFREGLADVMDAISLDLGFAVSNTMINEMLTRRESSNELLFAFSRDLAEVKTREDLSRTVTDGLKKLITFNDFFIIELVPDEVHPNFILSSLQLGAAELQWLYTNSFIKDLFMETADLNMPLIFQLSDLETTDPPLCFGSRGNEESEELLLKILPGPSGSQFGLILISNKTNVFDLSDRALILRISGHLATAVSNVVMHEELVRREKDKEILLAFSHDIASVRNKDDLRKAIEKVSGQLSSIARFVIRGINDDQETMTIYIYDDKVKKGVEENGQQFILNKVFPLNDGISEVVLAGNETMVFELQEWIDAGKASSFIYFWRGLGAQKCVATPLKTGGRNLGIFWVDSEYPDVKMIGSICAQISIAMSNILANEELLKFKQRLEVENEYLQEQIRQIYNSSEIIGTSSAMQEVYQLMSLVANSNASVLIQGETGTGKELIARGIHESSQRKNQIMVKVNCAAMPLNLIESELFGYEKGAFTGAYEKRIGKFELAHRGTLFLDEIGELPLEIQVKLLRVLQEREFERLGGKVTIKVDVRIITATNRDLKTEVDAGRFRSDLYYRLNVFPIQLPPLRERRKDIPYLAHFFLGRYSKSHSFKVTGISAGTMNELKAYSWPGNVRELEHMIERSVLLSTTKNLTKVYLPDSKTGDCAGSVDMNNLESVERRHIIEILSRCNGKVSGKGGAAELLKLPSSTLNSKMKKLGITKSSVVK